MRPGHIHYTCWTIARWAKWLSVAALFAVLVLPHVPKEWIPPSGLAARERLRKNSDSFAVLLTLSFSVSDIVGSAVGAPRMWTCVNGILHDFQKSTFDGLRSGEYSENHRVTLYKFYSWLFRIRHGGRWCYPWEGWLVPVARAGSAKNATTIFMATNSSRFEGVCGAAFFSQASVHQLPMGNEALVDINSDSKEQDLAEYAEKTFVTIASVKDRLRRNRPCARIFLSFKVEIGDKPWGVVMIDSRAGSLPNRQKVQHKFEQVKDTLKRILEGF